MTSLGVRQYIIGIYRQLSLKEEEITKVQTGGPDGDLGSNEILLSKDKTVAIIDGSGVIHDPLGLDRGELQRLARERKMVSHFDATKLSKEGYRVLVEDRDFKLPSKEGNPSVFEFCRQLTHHVVRAQAEKSSLMALGSATKLICATKVGRCRFPNSARRLSDSFEHSRPLRAVRRSARKHQRFQRQQLVRC